MFFRTLIANMPVISVLFSLSWVVGMVIFANYADCDPMSRGYTTKFDEIVPFYVEDKFVYLPGLLGLVMATLFNSALTITVSIINSVSTVTFEDFLSQIPAFKNLKDTQQLNIIKLIGVFYGFVIIGLSFLVGMLSGVIESSMLMTSATSGPLLGVFILAMLVPCANWKGAAAGMIFSHVTTLWLTFGRLTLEIPTVPLPLSVDGCANDTFSPHVMKALDGVSYAPEILKAVTQDHRFEDESPETFLDNVYAITYMYYALIGSMSTVTVGILVSLLTADSEEDAYPDHLLHPFVLKLSRLAPGKPRLYQLSTRLPDSNTNSINSTNNNNNNNGIGNKVPVDHRVVQIDKTSYGDKLNALRKATLEVTNEINKGTKFWQDWKWLFFGRVIACVKKWVFWWSRYKIV